MGAGPRFPRHSPGRHWLVTRDPGRRRKGEELEAHTSRGLAQGAFQPYLRAAGHPSVPWREARSGSEWELPGAQGGGSPPRNITQGTSSPVT